MEFELKTLSPDAVPRALEKAERYRLLNEPGEAESICLDVLEVDPDNQEALVTLLLALTDQFDTEAHGGAGRSPGVRRAAAGRVRARLLRAASSASGAPKRTSATACPMPAPARTMAARGDGLLRAGRSHPAAGNDDALLRWNACARLIMRDRHLVPAEEERGEPLLLE